MDTALSTDDFRIRPVRADEMMALRAFAERTFRAAWQDDNEPEAFEAYCRKAFTLEKLQTEAAEPGTVFYFAESGGQVIAYLKLRLHRQPHDRLDADALQLERVYVDSSLQSRGLGGRLLAFTEQCARENGMEWVWLSVWQKSPRSIAFYRRNGYEIFGVETFWIGDDPQPDWLMRKKIA